MIQNNCRSSRGPELNSSIHTVAHNHPSLPFQGIWQPLLISACTRHLHGTYTSMKAKHSFTYNKHNLKILKRLYYKYFLIYQIVLKHLYLKTIKVLFIYCWWEWGRYYRNPHGDSSENLKLSCDSTVLLLGLYLKDSDLIHHWHLHTHIHCSSIHNSQEMEPA